MIRFVSLFAWLLAASAPAQTAPPGFAKWELTVDGLAREALVHSPPSAREKAAPVVFVFHGHGGTMGNAARGFAMGREWPEAIAVYPQGVNTPGRLTDPEGKKSGWQGRPGDHGDRDLKFFDALLARLHTEFQVDDGHIHATGHSNGGGFTYLLWATRGTVLASVAPSAAAGARPGKGFVLQPKPAMHLAGENDALVKYTWQQAAMDEVRRINGCAPDGKPWAPLCTEYPSAGGTPFISFIHPGGHEFHHQAPALIARFFKEHPAK